MKIDKAIEIRTQISVHKELIASVKDAEDLAQYLDELSKLVVKYDTLLSEEEIEEGE